MFDPMIRHYQRLYSVKPSPEIASLRPRSKQNARPRRGGSLVNLSRPGSNMSSMIVPGVTSRPRTATSSVNTKTSLESGLGIRATPVSGYSSVTQTGNIRPKII